MHIPMAATGLVPVEPRLTARLAIVAPRGRTPRWRLMLPARKALSPCTPSNPFVFRQRVSASLNSGPITRHAYFLAGALIGFFKVDPEAVPAAQPQGHRRQS